MVGVLEAHGTGALLRELDRGCTSHPPAAAGDQRAPTLELPHLRDPPVRCGTAVAAIKHPPRRTGRFMAGPPMGGPPGLPSPAATAGLKTLSPTGSSLKNRRPHTTARP